MIDNETYRHGSAHFADGRDAARAGLFEKHPNSVFVGFLGRRPLYYSGAGGLLLIAGARAGKMRDILAYTLCTGTFAQTLLMLDMKGEGAAISQDQTADNKACITWNPLALHGLPQHRINPVDYIRADSPSLVSDVKLFCENMIPPSGAAQSIYFEGRAAEFLEGIVLTLVKLKGRLTLPDLYHILNLIPGNGDDWLNFAFEMTQAGHPLSKRVEEEIAASRDHPSNGFQGILGELFKAFACLSDPVLLASVSPPFDFSFADACRSDQAYQIYLMPPAEFVQAWGPVIKALFVAGMVYKSRAPSVPQQTWILDECAQLGAFPLVPKLFSYGAGIGIRPWAVYQATNQMKLTAPDGETIIPASAALRQYFAVRDIQTATQVSRQLGMETLGFDEEFTQARARHAKQRAAHALISGEDPFGAALDVRFQQEEATRRSVMQRALRTPDEVLNTPGDKQYLFTDGLGGALYADRAPFYEQRFMAGRYFPNPYHPPADRVRVKTLFGHGWRRVITEPIPARFAHLPQYQSGLWSRLEKIS